jgi:hypothetical protein
MTNEQKERIIAAVMGKKRADINGIPNYSIIHSADGELIIKKISNNLELQYEFDNYCIDIWSHINEINEPYSFWFIQNCIELFADFLKYCFDNNRYCEWFWIISPDDTHPPILTDLGKLMRDVK